MLFDKGLRAATTDLLPDIAGQCDGRWHTAMPKSTESSSMRASGAGALPDEQYWGGDDPRCLRPVPALLLYR